MHNTHAFPIDSKFICSRKIHEAFVAVLAVLLLALCSLAAAQNRTYTIEDLLKVRRVGDPQVSPDGNTSRSTIGDVNLERQSRSHTDLSRCRSDGKRFENS
jgi:hypothetical protein